MSPQYLPDDLVVLIAELLCGEDQDGLPLLSNLKSFVQVNKQFYRCGMPYLYSTYANSCIIEHKHGLIRQPAGRFFRPRRVTRNWPKPREVTSLWPFVRTLLESPDLGKHLRRIIHPRPWVVNKGDRLSLGFVDETQLVLKHFPASLPQSDEAIRYQSMLDGLSRTSSVVQKDLGDPPMTNASFGPTSEVADFLLILSCAPNLEELRFHGNRACSSHGAYSIPIKYVNTYSWSTILAEIPHKFTRLHRVELCNNLWDWDECYDTVSYLMTIPSIESLTCDSGRGPAAPSSKWLCPARSSNVRSLESLRFATPDSDGHEQFRVLLFSSCKELEHVSLDVQDRRLLFPHFVSTVIASLATFHQDFLGSLKLRYRASGTVPIPKLSMFSVLRHLEICVAPRGLFFANHQDRFIADGLLPATLQTLLIKRDHGENVVMRHVGDIIRLLDVGSLPDLEWVCVAQGPRQPTNHLNVELRPDESLTLDRYKSSTDTGSGCIDFQWSFNNLLACFPSFVRWQAEGYRHSLCLDSVRRRHAKGFKNWSAP